jgi:hypothetical protein
MLLCVDGLGDYLLPFQSQKSDSADMLADATLRINSSAMAISYVRNIENRCCLIST